MAPRWRGSSWLDPERRKQQKRDNREPNQRVQELLRNYASEFSALREEILTTVLATRRADRVQLEQAISNIYLAVGFRPPKFVWFKSFGEALVGRLLLMNYLANERQGMSETVELFFKSEIVAALAMCGPLADDPFLREVCGEVLGPDFNAERIEGLILAGVAAHIEKLNTAATTDLIFSAWESIGGELCVDPSVRLQSVQQLPALTTPVRIACRKDYQFWDTLGMRFSPLHGAQSAAIYKIGRIAGVEATPRAKWIIEHLGAEELLKRPTLCSLIWDAAGHGGWWYPFKDVCCVWDGPEKLCVDQHLRLHHDTESAVRFADGWELYFLDGIPVSERIIRASFFVHEIDEEVNQELRQIMIRRYGLADYIRDTGAEVLHRDEFGVLYRSYRRSQGSRHPIASDEPVLAVQVTDATPDADGQHKQYFLRVPPHIRTAREAVAWSFEFNERAYAPEIET